MLELDFRAVKFIYMYFFPRIVFDQLITIPYFHIDIYIVLFLEEYWTTNKSMKESKEIILMVEVVCYNQNNDPVGYYSKLSEPINNASKLEKEKKELSLITSYTRW